MGNNNTSNKSVRLSNLTAVSKTTSDSLENKEDVTLIWLDRSIDSSRTTLREITNYVLLYTDVDPCVTYIRSISQERIFLIVSGAYAKECLDQVHHLSQVDSIFVFCMNLEKYQHELIDSQLYPKIIDIFDSEERLIQSVREELDDLRKQLSTFSLYEKQKPTRDLSKESASFLWFQLFKDVLLRMPRSEAAKSEMIEQCRQYYRGNAEELQNIDEFARTYTDNDTIRWYTKQCFIYRLCNKSLRTEDVELLYIFRYYIQDLCKRLAVEHRTLLEKDSKQSHVVTLYRGLKLTREELTRFQSNVGSLISTNGFLSTTRNYELALQFALKSSKRSIDVLPTLFILDVGELYDDAVFADIALLSVYPDEEEVLFDLGCAFKINEVYFDDAKDVWIIKMNLSNEARQIVQKYIEANRQEMEKGNVFLVFGLLLTEMGQYHQAQVYFEKLLASNTVEDRVSLYTNIGRVKFLKGSYDEALKDFKAAFDIQRQETPVNQLNLARTMNNLGLIYLEEKKYDLALDYHFDVVKIYKEHPEISELLLANSDNSIGVIFTHKCDYDRALKYLLRATKIYETVLPTIDHPLMATNYNSLGLVFYYRKEYESALDYCLKALNIREKLLPVNHPHIADSCNNVALVYHHLHDYEKAFSLFERSLRIYESNADQKMRIPTCLNNVGLLYLDEHDYDQAIDYYFKAWEFYQKEKDPKKYQEEMQFTLDNLGVAYEMKGDLDNALKYYNQAIENPTSNLDKFVRIANKIGNIYQQKIDYPQALDYYQKALDQSQTSPPDLVSSILMSMGIIYHRKQQFDLALDTYREVLSMLKKLPSTHQLDIAWTYNNLGCLYDDMGDIHRALRYQEKSYQLRKELLPSTHLDLAKSLNSLGHLHQTLARYMSGNPVEIDQAVQNYKAALHIRRKSLSADHVDLGTSYYNLASIHTDQQEYEQAYCEIQKALAIQRKKLAIDHPDLEQTLKLEKQIKLLLDYHIPHAQYQ